MATKAKAKAPQGIASPKGFTRVSTGNFPDSYDFKINATLTGTVTEIKTVTTTKKEKGKMVRSSTRIAYVVDSEGVVHGLWEKAALRGLFDALEKKKKKGVGSRVWITLRGMKKIPGQKQPMYDFDTAIG